VAGSGALVAATGYAITFPSIASFAMAVHPSFQDSVYHKWPLGANVSGHILCIRMDGQYGSFSANFHRTRHTATGKRRKHKKSKEIVEKILRVLWNLPFFMGIHGIFLTFGEFMIYSYCFT
jgi:hypothetical protein